jgi:hypothetical protein
LVIAKAVELDRKVWLCKNPCHDTGSPDFDPNEMCDHCDRLTSRPEWLDYVGNYHNLPGWMIAW